MCTCNICCMHTETHACKWVVALKPQALPLRVRDVGAHFGFGKRESPELPQQACVLLMRPRQCVCVRVHGCVIAANMRADVHASVGVETSTQAHWHMRCKCAMHANSAELQHTSGEHGTPTWLSHHRSSFSSCSSVRSGGRASPRPASGGQLVPSFAGTSARKFCNTDQ